MSQIVVQGSLLKCSFGTAPSPLVVLPNNRCLVGGLPAANIADAKPLLNVISFGLCCMTPPFPGPCIPKSCMWISCKKVLLGGMPLLDKDAKLICMSGGLIEVVTPAQFTVEQA